jgi:hypothetical protein
VAEAAGEQLAQPREPAQERPPEPAQPS